MGKEQSQGSEDDSKWKKWGWRIAVAIGVLGLIAAIV